MQPERSTEEKTLMKVGRISILTAFLLALPLVAFAGGDPCAGLGGDTDGDTICDDNDNCPTVSNVGQADTDVGGPDGRGDACDNCTKIQNGPSAYAAGLAAVSQCDRDSDGYGNACDGDLNADGFVLGSDNSFYLAGLMAFIPTTVALKATDMDCNGFVLGSDNSWYLAQLMAFIVGPSGRSCKGVVTGACPPLP
jgi:hypothetical protein